MAGKKKKRNYNNVKLLVAAGLILALVLFILRWQHARQVRFAHYAAFNIDLPVDYHWHGIDVSRYQQKISWQGVHEMEIEGVRIRFAFIKATEGTRLTDKYFKRNWKNARNHKITRGAYHFFLPQTDAARQARYFMSRVKLERGDLPPVLDAEHAGQQSIEAYRAGLRIWLNLVETHYQVKPIIYTNADFYKKYMGDDFEDYPLWIAHYYERKQPRIKREWQFWQHNDRGRVNGINGPVDFNVFNGDSLAFARLLLP